jgi:hypothetical protein
MKFTFLCLIAAFSILTAGAHAQNPAFVPASGLHLTLNTGGYKFFVGDTGNPSAAARTLRNQASALGGILPAGESFAASVVLANFSRSNLDFAFVDAGAAATKFKFVVSDDAGAVVWESDADTVSAQVITPATLEKGKRWKRVLQIPLKVGGAWLKSGLYTLEAKLAATPSVSSKVIFAVAPVSDVTGNTGISGRVLQEAPPNPLARIAPRPVKAQLSIREIRLPNARYDHPAFSFDGVTDDLGAFKVVTPAGRYRVTAKPISLPPVNTTFSAGATLVAPAPSATVEVSVEKGAFTDTTITIPATAGETGITGTVLIGPITPVTTIGQDNERPLANAKVTITEIHKTGVLFTQGPSVFTPTTDADGKFKQLTPPGRYRLTVGNSGPANASIGSGASAEVTVVNGGLRDVTLHVDSGIR